MRERPFQLRRAGAGAARTSPGRSQKHKAPKSGETKKTQLNRQGQSHTPNDTRQTLAVQLITTVAPNDKELSNGICRDAP